MQVAHIINDNDKCKKCVSSKSLIESWIIKWMQIVYPTWYRLKRVDMFVNEIDIYILQPNIVYWEYEQYLK